MWQSLYRLFMLDMSRQTKIQEGKQVEEKITPLMSGQSMSGMDRWYYH